jgi:hypothetical protein
MLVLKLKGDASFQPSSMEGSWGFLIRDSDGDVVLNGVWKGESSAECLSG